MLSNGAFEPGLDRSGGWRDGFGSQDVLSGLIPGKKLFFAPSRGAVSARWDKDQEGFVEGFVFV